MPAYAAPLTDMRFVLFDLLGAGRLTALPGLEECDADLIMAVLGEAGRFCADVLAPLNRTGDEEGCRIKQGAVTTPNGFASAYARYRDGGWTTMGCDPAYGGQPMPKVVTSLLEEMVASTNLAFGSYPGLSHAGYFALSAHGSDTLKSLYLPRIVDGTWTATMCLTEPQCGTDLSLLRSRAVPVGDDTYRVTGTKIFITAGEHDLAENIIHLVLARLPDAPPGVRGISLFLVPKFLVNAEGALTERNALSCGGLEHKMGLKASATCIMNFDGATGWLVGEPHRGLNAMFSMMNAARLSVAQQGIGLAEASYQGARAYAAERLQGKAPGQGGEGGADPIIRHPDVKRMLLTQKAYVEGMRALSGWIGLALDERERHPDARFRVKADAFVALMTPVAKALFTDLGFECANLGVQVLGGHGYIRENGMEQMVRDCRIGQLYEGANGIQAQDLVLRKLRDGKKGLAEFFLVPARAAALESAAFGAELSGLIALLEQATLQVTDGFDAEQAAYVASSYLRLFGITALAVMWARMATLAEGRDDGFHQAKRATAGFFFSELVPQALGLAEAVAQAGRAGAAFEESLFFAA